MNRNVHISLVGGQPVPAYLGIVDACPQIVVLICSEQSHDEAVRIKECYVQQVEPVPVDIRCILPVDFEAIEKEVASLRGQYKDDNVTVNLTGGTKPWSLLFYKGFGSHEHVRFIYIDQNNVLTDIVSRQQHTLSLDVLVQFRLYGNPLVKYRSWEEYTMRDYRVAKGVERMRRFNFNAFNRLTTVLSRSDEHQVRYAKEGRLSIDDGSVSWNANEHVVELCLFNKWGKCMDERFESEHVMSLVFFSGWFEYLVAEALSHNEHAKQLWLNCEFPAHNNAPKNEVDVIVNMDGKLLFVECKTQLKANTAIDKFHSVVKKYGGMGSKGLFVTQAEMPQDAQEKCRESGISIYCFKGENPALDCKGINGLVNSVLKQVNK